MAGLEELGEQSFSTIYWCPRNAPKFKDTSYLHRQEIVFVRIYLEKCRRLQLLEYFIDSMDSEITLDMCCDKCSCKSSVSS